MAQSQAQWDAIASIRSNSPFAAETQSRNSSPAETLDALLPGYGTMSSLASGSYGEGTLQQVTERVRAAQQSTIDLYA